MNKVLRKVIKTDEELCNGCGQCVPSCAEGAIQIIDGKARLVSDHYSVKRNCNEVCVHARMVAPIPSLVNFQG